MSADTISIYEAVRILSGLNKYQFAKKLGQSIQLYCQNEAIGKLLCADRFAKLWKLSGLSAENFLRLCQSCYNGRIPETAFEHNTLSANVKSSARPVAMDDSSYARGKVVDGSPD
jgi:hypothetical protein